MVTTTVITPKGGFPCPRCGSEKWEYIDYGGCSECRSYQERKLEEEKMPGMLEKRVITKADIQKINDAYLVALQNLAEFHDTLDSICYDLDQNTDFRDERVPEAVQDLFAVQELFKPLLYLLPSAGKLSATLYNTVAGLDLPKTHP